MERRSKARLHAISGAAAMVIIAVFWTSALAADLWAGPEGMAAVRRGILYGLPVLVLALAGTGASGMALAGKSRAPVIRTKRMRMAGAAANGLLVLVPSAIWLGLKAARGEFDAGFQVVQAVELAAGVVNLTLLGLNMRAGLRMTAARRRGKAT